MYDPHARMWKQAQIMIKHAKVTQLGRNITDLLGPELVSFSSEHIVGYCLEAPG